MISTTFVLLKAHSFCIANELMKGEMVSDFVPKPNRLGLTVHLLLKMYGTKNLTIEI